MKIMYPERHGMPTVTSADANYPVANLIDNRRKKVWKAMSGVQESTLRVPISANAESVAIHNTNAETAICTITLDSAEKLMDASPAVNAGGGKVKLQIPTHGMSEGQIILINGTTNYDGVSTLPSQAIGDANNLIITATFVAETPEVTDTACVIVESTTHTLETATRSYDRFWQEYTSQIAAHTATTKLIAGAGETVEAGIARAAALVNFPNPKYGFSESREDFSIKKQLNNGAWYLRKRGIIRTYSASFILARTTEFYNLTDIYDHFGPNPMSILLVEDINDLQWAFFGHLLNPFSGSHTHLNHSEMTLQFTEAV